MKSVTCTNAKLEVVDSPTPTPAKGQLLIEVLRCGICGSDLHARHHCDELADVMAESGYDAFMRSNQHVVFGHEFCGEVLDYGPGTRKAPRRGTPVVALPLLRRDEIMDKIYAMTPEEVNRRRADFRRMCSKPLAESPGNPGFEGLMMVAALYVETGGCYFGLPNVDPWDEPRDARLYAGPYPVVAHPPCDRWHQLSAVNNKRWGYTINEDGGRFAAALAAVRKFGGVLEHPAEFELSSFTASRSPFRIAGSSRSTAIGSLKSGNPAMGIALASEHGCYTEAR